MAPSFDVTKAGPVLSPIRLAHVVLRMRTEDLPVMKAFYQIFLGAHIVFENEMLAFLTYDDEHHRIAMLGLPGLDKKNPMTNGLEHIAFTMPSLNEHLLAYRQRKAHNILPFWCVNHGPTLSMYYTDPCGNILETQLDLLTPDDATAMMNGPEYAINPIGIDFDPDEMIKRVEAGEEIDLTRAKGVHRGVDGVPEPKPSGFSLGAVAA